jgi:hypothetical protein
MKAFTVWVTRTDGASSLRVDGLEDTQWLLRRLNEYFVFKTCEPLRDRAGSSEFTFLVAHNSQMSEAQFERLLAGISGVRVVLEPMPTNGLSPYS